MESGRTRLAFVINHGGDAGETSIKLKLPAGKYAATDLVTGKPIASVYEAGGLNVKKRLAPGEVWVVRVDAG
jgi:hypothetical protein